MRSDFYELGRIYFPGLDVSTMTTEDKLRIESEIHDEFREAFIGIQQLPKSSRFGVYVSYVYYSKLLRKIKRKTTQELISSRIRIPNNIKWYLFAKSYVRNSMNLL